MNELNPCVTYSREVHQWRRRLTDDQKRLFTQFLMSHPGTVGEFRDRFWLCSHEAVFVSYRVEIDAGSERFFVRATAVEPGELYPARQRAEPSPKQTKRRFRRRLFLLVAIAGTITGTVLATAPSWIELIANDTFTAACKRYDPEVDNCLVVWERMKEYILSVVGM